MKIYVCWTTRRLAHDHPCAVAYDALRDAGYEPEVTYARGWAMLPDALNNTAGRREVRERSGGNSEVPAVILDDGTFIQGTKKIVEWAGANPAAGSSRA